MGFYCHVPLGWINIDKNKKKNIYIIYDISVWDKSFEKGSVIKKKATFLIADQSFVVSARLFVNEHL